MTDLMIIETPLTQQRITIPIKEYTIIRGTSAGMFEGSVVVRYVAEGYPMEQTVTADKETNVYINGVAIK